MELERLEVILDVNTERFQESMKKVMPQINNMLGRIEQATGRSKKTVETNMDMSSMTRDLERTMNEFTNKFSKQMDRMEEISKKKVTSTGRNFEQGFKKTRTSAGKEIDLMVKDINAKMGQARAAQNRIAELTAQRASAVRSNDTGVEVKYDEQIANAEARMTSYRNKATEMARAMKAEFDAVPSSLDNISATMEANEVRIEAMRNRIADMQQQYESQRRVRGSFSEGFTTEDSPQSRDTMIKIQEQADKMNKLISSNDQLQQAYANTETRAQMLRQALGGLNNELTTSSIQTGNATQGIQTTAHSAESARSAWSRFGGVFNRTSNFIAHGARRAGNITNNFFSRFNRGAHTATRNTNRMGRGTTFLSRTIGQLGRRIFVYGMLFRGITALGKGMFSALKTNEQFANSLNQIQVNLLTAFYPIYQAVLPALNALMEALARVTGYLAAFIATLFGTTYTAAKKGAQGLYENAKAMQDMGTSAKKAMGDTGTGATKAKEKVEELQRSLMGFDEINRIGLDVNADDSDLGGFDGKDLDGGVGGAPGGINFGGATGNYTTPEWLKNFADNVRDIMSRFFEPIRAAWDKHGQAVIDAFKYALNEVWELSKSIGRSFMEVWTNGTGEEFIGNILQLLETVLNIIGDITHAFRNAWDDEGRGTAAIQATFDMLNSVLELLRLMGETFREVWNDGTGERIAANLLEAYTDIVATIGELADRFSEAWIEASNGERIFGFLLGVVEKVSETIKRIADATREWAENLNLEPLLSSVAGMLENLEPIIANTLDGLGWLYENILLPISKWAVESMFPAVIDMISEAFRLLGNVIEVISPILMFIWENFLVPLGKWYGGRIVKTFENVGSALGFMADAVENPKQAFTDLKDTVFDKARGIYENVKTYFGRSSDEIEEHVIESSGISKEEWENMEVKASSSFGGIWESVKKAFPGINKDITDNSNKANRSGSSSFGTLKDNVSKRATESWESVKSNFDNVQKWVTDKSSIARKNGSNAFSTLRANVGTHFGNIWTNTRESWGNVATRISTKANEARTNGVNAFSRMRTGISGYLTEIQNTTSRVFDRITGWANGLGEKIGSGLRNGLDAVRRGSASIANGIIGTIGKAINGVINGVNWILRKVGAGRSQLSNWTVPTYATGTDAHPGGLAIVNDAPGSKFREAYEVNGQVGLFPNQRNMLVNLPKGAKVLDGNRTEAMYGNIPRYANGIGNWFSKAWDGAKGMVGTVWDYIKNPSKLLEVAISKFVNLTNTVQPQLDMAKGVISTVSSGATSFVKKFLEQGQEDVTTGSGGGVNFRGLRQTSPFGYRIHPIYRTRRLHAGVDFAGGQGIGHPIHSQTGGVVTNAGSRGNGFGIYVSIRQGIMDHIYAHLNRALVNVGQSVKRGDLIGQMGNTGASTGPHVHYEVRRRGVPVNPMGYENGGLVSNDGYYRLAEGNKKELVIPLERKNRALELLEVAKEYLGVNDIPVLQMPEAMLSSPTSRFTSPAPTREFNGGGLSGMSNSLEMLMSAIASSGNQGSGNLEVTLEVDRTNLGKVVIKEINEVIDTTGRIPLDI